MTNKLESGGMSAPVPLGTRSLRPGFKVPFHHLGTSAGPQDACLCPATGAKWEAVTALGSSLVSASSSEGRFIDHESPLPVCHGPGRHGQAAEELKIIATTWQTWLEPVEMPGYGRFLLVLYSPSLPPCFCTARFQPPGDRLLKKARPASAVHPSCWGALH